MRGIIILILLVLLMGLAGWITFSDGPGRTSINIETDEIQQDTEKAIENTERVIDSGTQMLQNEEQPVSAPVEDPDSSAKSAPTPTSPTETPITSPAVP